MSEVMSEQNIPMFVYGTLISPRVCSVVLGRVPEGAGAVLKGYRRFGMRGRLYPAIREEEGAEVRGRVLYVSPSEVARLDQFESDEYTREQVPVTQEDEVEEVKAEVYVAREFVYPDMQGDWDFEKFEKENLSDFIGETKEYMEGEYASD